MSSEEKIVKSLLLGAFEETERTNNFLKKLNEEIVEIHSKIQSFRRENPDSEGDPMKDFIDDFQKKNYEETIARDLLLNQVRSTSLLKKICTMFKMDLNLSEEVSEKMAQIDEAAESIFVIDPTEKTLKTIGENSLEDMLSQLNKESGYDWKKVYKARIFE